MRAAVLWHLVQYDEPHSTLNEAKKIIQGFSNPPSEPRNAKLDRFKDELPNPPLVLTASR